MESVATADITSKSTKFLYFKQSKLHRKEKSVAQGPHLVAEENIYHTCTMEENGLFNYRRMILYLLLIDDDTFG